LTSSPLASPVGSAIQGQSTAQLRLSALVSRRLPLFTHIVNQRTPL
jgi:hypothetical protein